MDNTSGGEDSGIAASDGSIPQSNVSSKKKSLHNIISYFIHLNVCALPLRKDHQHMQMRKKLVKA